MRVAIGPATSPPCPEAPCTITATTYFGWSNGAKHVNHATFSSWPRSVACAVPVFPATTQSSKGLCEPSRFCPERFPAVNPIARAAVALLDCLADPTPESRLASKLYRPDVGNSIYRHLRSPHRPSLIARAKQACIPGRSKHWRFELVTISPGDDEFASTLAPAYCRFVRLTVAGSILRPFPTSCQRRQSTECQLRFRTDKKRSRTTP